MENDIINKRVGLGAGIGGLTGFLFGGPVGGVVGALAGGALAKMAPRAKRGEMTPDRETAYREAMGRETATPEELEELAETFKAEGLVAEAEMLFNRASLRRLPPEIIAQRKDIYRKAMTSDNPEEIREFASSFDAGHAIKGAESLRKHADAVEAAHAAGKSAKPMEDTKAIEMFGAKLAKAITHFAADSDEVKSAARNFNRARGAPVTDEEIDKVIKAACAELEEATKEETASGGSPTTAAPAASSPATASSPAPAAATSGTGAVT
jgi:hypothetical protein